MTNEIKIRENKFRNVVDEALVNDILGGDLGTLLDRETDSYEYKEAKERCFNKEQIVKETYNYLLDENNPTCRLYKIKKDIRFLTKERCIEIIEEVYDETIKGL